MKERLKEIGAIEEEPFIPYREAEIEGIKIRDGFVCHALDEEGEFYIKVMTSKGDTDWHIPTYPKHLRPRGQDRYHIYPIQSIFDTKSRPFIVTKASVATPHW